MRYLSNMKIPLIIKPTSFGLTDFWKAKLHDYIVKLGGECRGYLIILLPESRKQRKFYHGAVLTLYAYLNGLDYRDNEVLDFLHEELKREFNGEDIILDGKRKRMGRSTRGHLKEYLDRVIDYLEEQYGIDRGIVLNPELYKKFRDEIYGEGEFDTFIDYMKSLKLLK